MGLRHKRPTAATIIAGSVSCACHMKASGGQVLGIRKPGRKKGPVMSAVV